MVATPAAATAAFDRQERALFCVDARVGVALPALGIARTILFFVDVDKCQNVRLLLL